MQKTRFPL